MNNVRRSKKAIKFLEGVSSNQCGGRLKYASYQGDCQVFTDSYIAFKLKNHLNDLPVLEGKEYPNINDFIAEGLKDSTKFFNYDDVLKVLEKRKNDKIRKNSKKHLNKEYLYIFRDEESETIHTLDPLKVKTVIEILGCKPEELTVKSGGEFVQVQFFTPTGDMALIMQCKIGF